MSRFVRCSVLMAAGLAGAILALGSAQADAPRAAGLACVGPAWVSDRPVCRSTRAAYRRVRIDRPMVAEARWPIVDPAFYGPSRYASFLILGVGY